MSDLWDRVAENDPEAKAKVRAILDQPIVHKPFPAEPAGKNNTNKEDLRKATAEWIDQNPKLYTLFKRFSKEMVDHNRKFGMKQLAERIRWETVLSGVGEYKIPNDYVAYIARRIADDVPGAKKLLRFTETRY